MPIAGALSAGQLLVGGLQTLGALDEARMQREARQATLAELERNRLNIGRLQGYAVPYASQLAGAGIMGSAATANQFARNYQQAMLGGAAPPIARQPISPYPYLPPTDPTLGRAGLPAFMQGAYPELLRPAFEGDKGYKMRAGMLQPGLSLVGLPPRAKPRKKAVGATRSRKQAKGFA